MESRYSTINTTTLLLRPFFCPEKIERPVISLFHNLDKSTTLLTTTFSWPDSVDSHTLFHCTSSLENVFSRSPIGVVSFFFREFDTIQLQFHQVLLAASLSLQALLPVLQYPGSYHQKTPEMASSQDLKCSTKRKTLQGQQLW